MSNSNTLCTLCLFLLPWCVRSLGGGYPVAQQWRNTWCDGALVFSLTTGCQWGSSSRRNFSIFQNSHHYRSPLSPPCSSTMEIVLEIVERGRPASCQFYNSHRYSPLLYVVAIPRQLFTFSWINSLFGFIFLGTVVHNYWWCVDMLCMKCYLSIRSTLAPPLINTIPHSIPH